MNGQWNAGKVSVSMHSEHAKDQWMYGISFDLDIERECVSCIRIDGRLPKLNIILDIIEHVRLKERHRLDAARLNLLRVHRYISKDTTARPN